MTNFFDPPANGDSPRKHWAFPAPESARDVAGAQQEPCTPRQRAGCEPARATCANGASCAGRSVPVLLQSRSRPSAD